MRQITKADIDSAKAKSLWSLGNDVLYKLCRDYPTHDKPDAIVAKFWLIGRAYSAAIERRRNAAETSDDFYVRILTDKIQNSGLDQWLAELPGKVGNPWQDLSFIISTHKRLMDVLAKMTGLDKRSLASKYLHFHRPELFFIYDSRARKAIREVTPKRCETPAIAAGIFDLEYLDFCRRAQWLRDHVQSKFNECLTPRELDSILLRRAADKR